MIVYIILYITLYSKVFSTNVLEAGRKVPLVNLARSASNFGVCVECSVKYNVQYSVQFSTQYSIHCSVQ